MKYRVKTIHFIQRWNASRKSWDQTMLAYASLKKALAWIRKQKAGT